jgi:hypothetical protein
LAETLFILGDADRVREKVEVALFAGDLDRLAGFSRKLTEAIASMAAHLEQHLGMRTVMAGGDDVLFTVQSGCFVLPILRDVAAKFLADSGCSMSFGVGTTIEEAYVNLRKAKSSGAGIIGSQGVR